MGANKIRRVIAYNVGPSLKWLGRGCAIGEDASGVGVYSPGASTRSLL